MFIETLALLAIIAFLLYKWAMPKYNYFVDRNVKYDKFVPLLGSFKDLILMRKSIIDLIVDFYNEFDGEQYVLDFINNICFSFQTHNLITKIAFQVS